MNKFNHQYQTLNEENHHFVLLHLFLFFLMDYKYSYCFYLFYIQKKFFWVFLILRGYFFCYFDYLYTFRIELNKFIIHYSCEKDFALFSSY